MSRFKAAISCRTALPYAIRTGAMRVHSGSDMNHLLPGHAGFKKKSPSGHTARLPEPGMRYGNPAVLRHSAALR